MGSPLIGEDRFLAQEMMAALLSCLLILLPHHSLLAVTPVGSIAFTQTHTSRHY